MMRAAPLLVLALVGCGDSHLAPDAPVDDAVCKANLESALDRSCTAPTDCVLVESADCCGPIMLGIRAGTESGFPALEHTYETCLACPPLGCAHQTLASSCVSVVR
jgi:hypothetical protein